MAYLTNFSNYKEFGFLIARIGLGEMITLHGFQNLVGGSTKWNTKRNHE